MARPRPWCVCLACLWVCTPCTQGVRALSTINESITGSGSEFKDPTTHRKISGQDLEEQLIVAQYIAVAGLTLYAWEYLCTLLRELSMWLHPKDLIRPQVMLFLLIRYATIPELILPSYSLWGNFSSEQQCLKHEQVVIAVVQFFVSCIFSWRTIAIWRRERWIVVLLTVFTMLLLGTSIGLLYFSIDVLIVTGACRPAYDVRLDVDKPKSANTVMWFYMCSMIFDTTTLVLSMYKLFIYANMGRRVAATVRFVDPFAAHREQLEKAESDPAGGAAGTCAGASVDPMGKEVAPHEHRSRSSSIQYLLNLPSSVLTAIRWLYRTASGVYTWWTSLTPLVARLIANGLIYFAVATAYNVNNFVLEARQSLHSKSFLALYPPLMCVLCQRMLLTEFDAVWARYDPEPEYPGRQLVDRVVGKDAPSNEKSQSVIHRFEQYASALEERHASLVSPRGGVRYSDQHPSRFSSLMSVLPMPVTMSRRPSASSQPPQAPQPPPQPQASPPKPDVASQELAPSVSATPRTSIATGPAPTSVDSATATPRASESPGTAPALTHRTSMRPVSPVSPRTRTAALPSTSSPSHRRTKLTRAQEQQAIRMAGFM